MKISAGFHSSLAFPSLTCRNGEMGICECEGGFEYMRMRVEQAVTFTTISCVAYFVTTFSPLSLSVAKN